MRKNCFFCNFVCVLFSGKALYEIVHKSQLSIKQMVSPGMMHKKIEEKKNFAVSTFGNN